MKNFLSGLKTKYCLIPTAITILCYMTGYIFSPAFYILQYGIVFLSVLFLLNMSLIRQPGKKILVIYLSFSALVIFILWNNVRGAYMLDLVDIVRLGIFSLPFMMSNLNLTLHEKGYLAYFVVGALGSVFTTLFFILLLQLFNFSCLFSESSTFLMQICDV